MFDIEASDEEITKKKKWALLGLIILFFLVAGLGLFITPNEEEPSQVALADEVPTPTATLQPTSTPTDSPTAVPTVTSTSTPQATATLTALPATPTDVPPTVTPTSTADATVISAVGTVEQTGADEAGDNEFTPDVQTSDEEGAGEGGVSITESVSEETAAETSETAGEATAAEPTEDSTEAAEITSGEHGNETATETDQEESSAESGTSTEDGYDSAGSVETGSGQSSEATQEVISPETLPTTGLDGHSWGMTWLALGIILVLIGFGVTSASNNHSRW